ncbi:sigma factor-like helix-turn-helix DNA-binding protein [Streptomyces sp. SBT349]|uniref:sigma factor-like helix-turn-helix DNA-binding protein n=1 Tax=Streptomyces sp. SBT349 TaxID=1580539 RepID=UPI00069CD3E6|nr:sigma factor-like helix-turn-helix DNA-binding protein [Streptomyces sp. SBT349]
MNEGPAAAFDRLYAVHAVSLVRQTFLLCGRRRTAERAVARAFHLAWERWPEVAVDRDPAGWVRAAAYECALSPWHELLPHRRGGELREVPPEDRPLLAALLSLPPSYRRSLVLHDGVGLGLPETAAESEASTSATASRVARAREALNTPDLAARLSAMAGARPVRPLPAVAIRAASERTTRRVTLAALTVILSFATLVTAACLW